MKIPAYILAGGDSNRFGENKALYELGGTSMIQRLIQLLSESFTIVKIIAKSEIEYSKFNVPVLKDDISKQTPLAGILRGLEDIDEWGFFLACDMPDMNTGVIEALLGSLTEIAGNSEVTAVVASTMDQELQPLVACYHSSGKESVRSAIQNNYSMKRWLEESNIKRVIFGDYLPFKNINSKNDIP